MRMLSGALRLESFLSCNPECGPLGFLPPQPLSAMGGNLIPSLDLSCPRRSGMQIRCVYWEHSKLKKQLTTVELDGFEGNISK